MTKSKEHEILLTMLMQAIDIVMVVIAVFLTRKLSSVIHLHPDNVAGLILPALSTIILVTIIYWGNFYFFGFYKSFRSQTYEQVFSKTILGVLAGSVWIITTLFIFDINSYKRDIFLIFVLAITILLMVNRTIIYFTMSFLHKKGVNFRNILVVGSKKRALEMVEAIRSHPGSGYRILGCLEMDPEMVGREVLPGVKIVDVVDNLHQYLTVHSVDEVVFAIPLHDIPDAQKHVSFAEEIGVTIRVLPDWQLREMSGQPHTASIYFDRFIGLPTIALSSAPQKESELLLKSLLDYLLAIGGLIFISPFLLIIAVLIKSTSKGPVIYRQQRSGLNGRKFTLYKFRSMVENADKLRSRLNSKNEADGPVFKIKKDPRVTPIGLLLRKTCLDELPQLLNILKGEMSLVGPRPPLPDEVDLYQPWQRRRLSMKPGITCLWQIKSDRHEMSFQQWMKQDLKYIDTWSFILDIKILFKTIIVVFRATGR